MSTVREILGDGGPLAARLDGFRERAEQLTVADAVEQALIDNETLVVEAGTGTGKTFAYLVPALLSGKRVVVSTGTKTLQDQLFKKDLPMIRDCLELPVRTALLKGRSNYLCHYRLGLAEADGRFPSVEQAQQLRRIREWSGRTRTGDVAELPGGQADSPLWSRVTSTADNCLGQECPDFNRCFLVQARRQAQDADVVVVNHHLLMADMAIREGGFGEVLPSADAYILDEAHQLPEVAAQFFGVSISSRQIHDLIRDTQAEYYREAGDLPDVLETLDALRKAAQDLRLALGVGTTRMAWAGVSGRPQVEEGAETLSRVLRDLDDMLAPLAQRGRGLESCARRAGDLLAAFQAFLEPDEESQVQWFETFSQSFILRLTPLDVGGAFQGQMARHPGAWVFTSATLSVGGTFDHYRGRLGIDGEARTLQVESPFDFERNALLYAPQGLPEPNSPFYAEAFLEEAIPVIRASRGRAFVLFTSHRALREAAGILGERLDYPLLVQGESAQADLLERFRAMGDAVLLGTTSFWEGVDVRGEALSAVLIDRLPFASPSDPVTQARIESMKRGSGNPFRDYQLPQAVIGLRQGVGRLIRDNTDRGVLMIGDPRLFGRSYGRVFVKSLPPMPVTRNLDDVQAFFAAG